MKRLYIILAGVVVAAAVLVVVLTGSRQDDRPPPNVLIVLWDTVRADHLTPYGYDKPTTPYLGQWAENHGVVFENALSPAMWTVPSHASMFTGLMASSHGAGYDWRWLDHHHTTFAEWFQQNGWATYAFSANPNLSTGRVNLLQGFEHADLSWARQWKGKVNRNTRKKLLKKDRSTEISPAYRGGATSTFSYNAGPVTEEAFVKWLDGRTSKDKPWFVYLNYMEAHKPRVPSVKSRRKIADDDTIRLGLATDLTLKSQLEYSYYLKEYSEAELKAVEAVYDATLVDLDEATAALFEALRERGELENTIVVFTSDHGEALGEQHLFGHRHGVYQTLVHVPLILSYPGVLDAGRVSERVSNLDIYSTVCDLAGIGKPESPMSRGNLLASVGQAAQSVFTESISIDRLGWDKIRKWYPDNFDDDPRARMFKSVVHGDWKLILGSDGKKELYNLADDALEQKNLAVSEPNRLTEMEAQIEHWREGIVPYTPELRTEEDTPKVDSDMMKEQLKMLGYLSDDDEDAGGAPEEDELEFVP